MHPLEPPAGQGVELASLPGLCLVSAPVTTPLPTDGPILPTRDSPPVRCTGSHMFIITSYVLYISLTNTFPIAYLFPGAAVIDSHKLKWLGSLTGQMSETAPLD